VRLASGALVAIGAFGTLWPDQVRAMIGDGFAVDRLSQLALGLVALYLFTLLLLKPGASQPVQPPQIASGPQSSNFGTVHGNVTISNGHHQEEARKSSYSWSQESLDGLERVMVGAGRGSGQLNAIRSCPEMPISAALASLLSLGQSKEQARLALQQAFADDRVVVWGRAEAPPAHLQAPFSANEIWEPVHPDYWRDFRLSERAFDASEDQPQTEAREHVRTDLLRRYWSLRVSSEQIKQQWPEPRKPPRAPPNLGPNGWMAG
jgi:hypothetical protein